MVTTLQKAGIPGGTPVRSLDRARGRSFASILCFDNLLGATGTDQIAITGASAGADCSIHNGTPEARFFENNRQKSQLKIEAGPDAVFTSLPFLVDRGLTIAHYQYFNGEWPVEDDFDFYELVQNGNVVFSLRITNLGGGTAGLFFRDADGQLTQIGGDDLLTVNTRHFIQIWIKNTHFASLVAVVDNVEVLRVGEVAGATDTAVRNFRDPAGGDLTIRLRNTASSPTLPTTMQCCGSFVQGGSLPPDYGFFPDDLISLGSLVLNDVSVAECDSEGVLPGPSLSSGTTGNLKDFDDGTDVGFSPNDGGAWEMAPLNISFFSERQAMSYHFLMSALADAAEGPPCVNLLYGSSKEVPSLWDMASFRSSPGVSSLAHYSAIVDGVLSPLPTQFRDSGLSEFQAMGFEVLGVSGSSQVASLSMAYAVGLYKFPFPTGNVLAGHILRPGMTLIDGDGYTGIQEQTGRTQVYSATGVCTDCCEIELLECKFLDNNEVWDLSAYIGEGIGPSCGAWQIRAQDFGDGFLIPIFDGIINEKGRLEGLPTIIVGDDFTDRCGGSSVLFRYCLEICCGNPPRCPDRSV